jgi:hypothetical protein
MVPLAASHPGFGIAALAYSALAAFYVLGPLWRSDQAGIYIPGPAWLRRSVVALTGVFMLVVGIAALIGY